MLYEVITVLTRKRLADLVTPVSIFLHARKKYKDTLLLESSDYHGNENSYSFICIDPVASFQIEEGKASVGYPDGRIHESQIVSPSDFRDKFDQFIRCFRVA